MQVARLKVEKNKALHHHPGVISPWDVSLCGHDLHGDEELGWGPAEKREGVVTCQDCAKIIHASRSLERSDYVLARK